VSLGDRRAYLVSISIPAADSIFRREISSQAMTSWHTLGLCSALAVSMLLFCGLGAAFLRILKIKNLSVFDTLLFSAATGTILLELAVSAGELAPNIRTGVRITVALAALLGLAGVQATSAVLQQVFHRLRALGGIERPLAALFLLVLALQGFASLAPLNPLNFG